MLYSYFIFLKMSSATPAQAKQIMGAVAVLQKFAKTGKVGAVETMDAKRRKKTGGKKPAAKKTTKKATGGKKKAAKRK